MNNVISVRLYFLFALFLLFVSYRLTQGVKVQLQEAQAKQAAQIERALSSVD